MIGQIIDLDEQDERLITPNNIVPEGVGVIDLEDLEERFEAEFEAEQALPRNEAAAQATRSTRNPPIAFPWVSVESIKVQDLSLKCGKTVELRNGEFLQISRILKNSVTMMVKLRGWRLKRCKEMGGLLPKKLNELCFIYEVLLDDPRLMLQQSVIEVGLEDVVKLRLLIRTNFPFPKKTKKPRWDAVSLDEKENERHVLENERLTVRWKYITFYDNAQEQAKSPAYQGNIRKRQLLPLNKDECTSPEHFMSPDLFRFQWRGETKLGGSYKGQKYSYGDACKSSDSLFQITY
jgi:DNA (cytosine-5)-methyltransferase 1